MGHEPARTRRVAVALVGVAAVAVLLWLAARHAEPVDAFPTPLLQAEGVLLTALVFFLTLGQGRLRRGCDAVLKEAHDWESRVAKAYVDRTPAVSTADVWDWAVADSKAVPFSGDSVIRETKGRGRLYRKFVGDQWRWERLESAVATRGEPAESSEPDHLTKTAEELGVLSMGLGPLVGRFKIVAATSYDLVRLAAWVSVAMLVLVALGVVVGGRAEAIGDPAAWGAVTLLGLAVAYSRVVALDIDTEVHATTEALKASWLVALVGAETQFGMSLEEERASAKELSRSSEWLVSRARASNPALPWAASLQGRQHLARANESVEDLVAASARDATIAETEAELGEAWTLRYEPDFAGYRTGQREAVRRQLTEAERLLSGAAQRGDDPLAELALARLIELRLDLHGAGEVPLPSDADVAGMRRSVAELTSGALRQMTEWGEDRWNFYSGKMRAAFWLREQASILRPRSEDDRAVFDAISGYSDPEAPATA